MHTGFIKRSRIRQPFQAISTQESVPAQTATKK